MDQTAEILGSIERLSRDLRNASATLSQREARFLVDAYYAMQRDRIRAAHQNRTLAEGGEPHTVMDWLATQRQTLETRVASALDAYSASQPAGKWARSICGVGPVIASGLLANLDITLAPTVGHFWRFAGLDPTVKWDKNEKRPWNAGLKRLLWLLGESFTKVSGRENDIYGKVYKERKAWEQEKNERGDYADLASAALERFTKETGARKHYLEGRLPPGRIHLRAQRVAVKLFLSHLHHVMYELHYGSPPPKPYILDRGGHAHFIGPPNWPMKD